MTFPDSLHRELMQQSTESFLILDQRTIRDCNPSAAYLFGLTPAELIGTSVLTHSPLQQASGQDSGEDWDALLKNLNLGADLCFEWFFQRSDGSLITAEVTLSYTKQRETVWILASIHDIHNAQQIQSALLEKRLELQTLLDNFPGGVAIVDNSRRFVAWNQEFLSLTGFSEAIFCPDTPPDLIEIYRINLERGEYGELPPEITADQYLQRRISRVREDGGYHFQRTRPNGMVLEVRGVSTQNGGFVAIYNDVTEQQAMKEQLEEQSVLLLQVLEHMSAGIIVFDQNLRLKVWNSGVADMLNIPSENFKPGVAYEDLLRIMLERGERGERGECGEVDVEQELQAHMVFVRQLREHRCERTSSNGRTFLIHGQSVFHDNQIAESITTLTEITERKQAENALRDANIRLEKLVGELNEARTDVVRSEKLAALGALVAGVAHKLNTPLGNCLMMASSIHEFTNQVNTKVSDHGITKNDLIDYFNQVEDAMNLLSRNLNSATDLILRFKQVVVTESDVQRSTFNLTEFANEVALITRNRLQDAGHRLVLEIEAGLEMDSYFAPLEQVLVSLINNAVLHAFQDITGGIMVFSAHRADAERVLIEFRDNGCGIEKENLGRIFDPFFTTRMGQGSTGLGLQTSYNIITSLLGGEIGVHSEPGAGATFTVYLPLRAPQNH
jgi:PAS domain S-box-containing protein